MAKYGLTHLALFLCAGLALVSAAPSGEEQLIEKARMLMDFQSTNRGDRDAAVRFAISASRDCIGTPLAEFAVRFALKFDPAGLSNVNVGEAEARRILANEGELAPEHRDALRRFVARSFTASGRRDDAMEVHRRRGLAMSWLVSGPFPGLGIGRDQRGQDRSTEIHQSDVIQNPPDAEQFRRWRKNPPWRALDPNRSFPYVHPWKATGRSGDGAVVMFTTVDLAEADNKSLFHIQSDVSWRLYVDASLAAEVDKNSREVAREHTVPFPLSPGRHTVLLELFPPPVGEDAEEARFALRLEAAPAFTWDCHAASPDVEKRASARREARSPRYLAELHRAAMETNHPALLATLAQSCSEQDLPDAASWWAEKAAGLDPADATLAVLAGSMIAQNPLLPPERRQDLAREWHRKALGINADLVPSLLFMAREAMEAGDSRLSAEYLERARKVNPNSIDVLLERGAWARRFASGSTVRAIWDESGKVQPTSVAVQNAIAAMPKAGFLDMDHRLSACRAAYEAGPYLPETGLKLAEALADLGKTQEADFILKNTQELFKGEAGVLEMVSGLYTRMEMHKAAAAAMEDAVRVTPENDKLWRRLGDIRLDMGEPDGAVKFWQVSLDANPGQFELGDMIANFGKSAPQLYNEGGHDAIVMTANADADRYGTDVVRLLDRVTVTFAADGSYRRLTHEIDLARTQRGGELLTGIDQKGELLTARIVFPTGNTLEPEPFPGQGGLRLPVIMPGASREIRVMETVAADQGPPVLPPWFFQDPSGRIPLVLSEYIIRAPRDFPLVYVMRNLGSEVEFELTREDNQDVYRWTAHLASPIREPGAVHVSERVPSVEIGVKTTWEDVAARELRKFDGKLTPSMRMRQLLGRLQPPQVSGRPNPLEMAKAIYRYVLDEVDPDGGGEVAAHIEVEQMGDRNLLLLALLKAAGLDAQPAMARPSVRAMYPATWEIPSRSIFTVPMVRLSIPGGSTYFLDTRFDSLPFGKIPDDLSGATVLSLLSGGPLFETLPTLPAEDSIIYRIRTVKLPAEGAAVEVSGRSWRRGVAGLVRDQALATADAETRRDLLLTSLYPVFPDAVLKQFDVQRTDDTEASSLERYEISSNFPLERRPGGVISVGLCLMRPRIITPETRNLTRRGTACHIQSLHIAEDRNVFRLPEGGRFVRLPRPAHLPSRFGVYQLRVTERGDNSLEISRKYQIPEQRIMPWDWRDFLVFLEDIDLAEKQWIEYVVSNEAEGE